MAERRMFAKTIIDSDAFLDMPLSTQALYFHLNMRADDDGFVNNPKKISRMIGASDDDLKLLMVKAFIIPFDNGVVVIKHWRINNYIRTDRYKETVYQEEKGMLELKENGAYTTMLPLGIPNGNQMETQDSIGKDSIGKDKHIGAKKKTFSPPTLEEITAYCQERHNNVNPQAFFDYFEAGKWVDSKGNPVKNWKQKIITWEKYEPKESKKGQNFDQHSNYDFDEIERLMG